MMRFKGRNQSQQETLSISNSEDSTGGIALIQLTAYIVSPGVQVAPKLEDVNEALVRVAKNILSIAKGISQWQKGCKSEVDIFFDTWKL